MSNGISNGKYILPPGRTEADDARCLKCFYHGICDNIVCCEFLLTTGRRRQCPPGVACTRFLKGDSRRRWGLEMELPPGVIPGQPSQQPEEVDQDGYRPAPQKRERRVPVDRRALKSIGKTYKQIAGETGYSVASLRHAGTTGLISPELARRIQLAYGVDVIFSSGGGTGAD